MLTWYSKMTIILNYRKKCTWCFEISQVLSSACLAPHCLGLMDGKK